MNLSQITMVLEVYQKHQLLSNEPYEMIFFFNRCKLKKKDQEHSEAGHQTALPF